MGIETPSHFISQHQQQTYQQAGQQYPALHLQHHQHHMEHLPAHHTELYQRQLLHHSQHSPHLQQQHLHEQQHHQQQQQQQPPLPTFTATKRKLSSDSTEHNPKRPPVANPEVHAASQPRNIQPRPPSNGFASASPGPTAAAPAPYKVPRKRGRPSRADKNAQAQARGTTMHPYPYIAPAARPLPANEPGPPISLTPPSASPKARNTSPKLGEDSVSITCIFSSSVTLESN